MAIMVIRHTGWVGEGSALAIIVNGKKVAKVSPEQLVYVDLPENHAALRVSKGGMKSNQLDVQDGETIEITNPKRMNTLFFSSLLLFSILNAFITSLIPTFRSTMVVTIIFSILYMSLMFQINWYQLKKI